MPFIIGYYGKDSSLYAQKIKELAYSNGVQKSLAQIQTEHLTVYAGIYQRELHCPDSIITLGSLQGLLAGKLFTQETYQQIFSFDDDSSYELISNPALLTKNYWGRYAAVLYDKEHYKITLVRDPLGLNTIFYMQLPDGLIFATDIALIYDCLEQKPSVNWNYFADYVIGEQYAPALTPFNGLFELQPGMGLHYTVDGTISKVLLWDIHAIKSDPITDQSAFEEKLLHTLKECTKAWIKDSKGVCVELSGGTDSTAMTILAREVLRPDQKLIAVNYIDSKQPSSNEIEHAQEVASLCNAELFFPDWQDANLFDSFETDWRPNRPSTCSLFRTLDKIMTTIVQSQNCTEIINGQGGDHVFLALPPEHALADYWLEKGFCGSMGSAHDLAGQYRMSVTSLLWKNLKVMASHFVGKTFAEPSYINTMPDSISRRQTEKGHYLNVFLKNQKPAKKQHFKALAHAVAFAERNQRSPYWITNHPLLSQPVVELGLQIPAFQTFGQGFDRIFFRKAVSKVKKPKALWRQIKGQTTSSMINALAKNADVIEKMLVEGSLMREGLIDKKWLEQNMIKIRHGSIENSWPIINLVSAQQWLNQWGL